MVEWNKLLLKSNGEQISDEIVKSAQLYQENENWIKMVKKEGI